MWRFIVFFSAPFLSFPFLSDQNRADPKQEMAQPLMKKDDDHDDEGQSSNNLPIRSFPIYWKSQKLSRFDFSSIFGVNFVCREIRFSLLGASRDGCLPALDGVRLLIVRRFESEVPWLHGWVYSFGGFRVFFFLGSWGPWRFFNFFTNAV